MGGTILTGQQSLWISWWAEPVCRALGTAAPRSSPTAGCHCIAAAGILKLSCGCCRRGGWRWNRPALAVKKKERKNIYWTLTSLKDSVWREEFLPVQVVRQTSCTASKIAQSKSVSATATSQVFKLSMWAVLCCSSELSVKGFCKEKQAKKVQIFL